MQPYLKTEYALINFHTASHAVVLIWLRAPSPEEFRNAMDKIAEAMRYFNTGKVLIDITRQGIVARCEQEWIKTDWAERALKDGHRHTGFVMPIENFSSLSTNDMVPPVRGMVIGYFDDMGRALVWISQF